MRRLLVPMLLLAVFGSFAPAAYAGCDPESDVCHPCDPMPWDPVAGVRHAVDAIRRGDPVRAATSLLPSACP
jgi:hypothetical protein